MDNTELYSDRTYRPTSVLLGPGAEVYSAPPSAQPSVNGAERSGESTPRRRRNDIEDETPTRAVSPRLLPPPQITASELPALPLPTSQIAATPFLAPLSTYIDIAAAEQTLAAGAEMVRQMEAQNAIAHRTFL